jgi:hypothetical protein
MKAKILIAIVTCVMALAFSARAVEGGMGHYAPGTFLDFSAVPPSAPGLYLGNYFMDYNNGRFGGNRELPLGGIFGVGVKANAQAEAPFAVFAYPWRPANITFSTGAYPTWVWERIDVSASFDRNGHQLSASRQQSASGFGDIMFSPIMGAWTNGDVTVVGMFNVWADTGEFQTGRLANPGLGYWTFEPMLAFSWLSKKFGTELTFFPAVDFNTLNHNTDYQSGDIFHIDATLAQHLPLFHGIIGAGVSMNYLKQFTGDSGSGARLGSFQAESLAVGPTISYVHPIGKTMKLIADGTWLPQVHTQNSPKGSYFWAKLTLAF